MDMLYVWSIFKTMQTTDKQIDKILQDNQLSRFKSSFGKFYGPTVITTILSANTIFR